MKYIILLIIVIAVLYVHYRGRVRYRFWRQLSDHSTFTAPLNGFMYLFSRVPNTPYLRPEMFPELAILQQNWQVIRKVSTFSNWSRLKRPINITMPGLTHFSKPAGNAFI